MNEPKTLNLNLDPKLLSEARTLFLDLGLSLESACEIFIRQALREDGFPFTPKRSANRSLPKANILEASKLKEKTSPESQKNKKADTAVPTPSEMPNAQTMDRLFELRAALLDTDDETPFDLDDFFAKI